MTLSIRVHSMLVLLALLLFTTTSFTSASLLDCLLHGSDSKSACEAIDDCVWCVASTNHNHGFCVSSDASQSLNPYFQCHDDVDTDDAAPPPSTDDDAAPPPSTDDYWPKNDDGGTFDDDAAVDDDAAPVVNDDAAATDDDANHNDDVDTDDQTPSTDDQTPSTDDQTPSTDDDASNDNYEKKLMECLAVGNQTACAKNTPTACIWCTTSFGTGLCVSEQASHDVDGHFYTCQFNSTLFSTVVVTPSEVYDHYCWNAQQEEACLEQVDGRDVPCVWSDEHDMCLSQAQVDLLELPKVAKEY
jgi:hypothetical protein